MRVSTSTILPNFQHDVKGKLPFVVINRKQNNVQKADEPSEMDVSDDSVFHTSDGIVKTNQEGFVNFDFIETAKPSNGRQIPWMN